MRLSEYAWIRVNTHTEYFWIRVSASDHEHERIQYAGNYSQCIHFLDTLRIRDKYVINTQLNTI